MRPSTIIGSCLIFVVPSCEVIDLVTGNSPRSIAAANSAKLQTLALGMNQTQVFAIMGESNGGLDNGIRSPFRIERAAAAGNEAVIVFYYTKCNPDGYTSEDELTPVVFVNDKLVGYDRSAITAMTKNLQPGKE